MIRVLPTVIYLALMIYSTIDCVQTPDDQVRHVPKVFWVVLIVLVPWVGAISWLIAGRQRQLPGAGRRLQGPKGPEDDPDFLRGL